MSSVNIVYPINGGGYPITDPPSVGVKSAYFTSSFSVTCGGGPHSAKWGFDDKTLGSAEFYDQMSEQFVYKLPGGKHTFWVKSDCGSAEAAFAIG
jgi:hypothetical protein